MIYKALLLPFALFFGLLWIHHGRAMGYSTFVVFLGCAIIGTVLSLLAIYMEDRKD